jgi:hypothetical protein
MAKTVRSMAAVGPYKVRRLTGNHNWVVVNDETGEEVYRATTKVEASLAAHQAYASDVDRAERLFIQFERSAPVTIQDPCVVVEDWEN